MIHVQRRTYKLTMESAKEQLLSTAIDLFETHGVKQSDMFSWIRDELKRRKAGRDNVDALVNVSKFLDFVGTAGSIGKLLEQNRYGSIGRR